MSKLFSFHKLSEDELRGSEEVRELGGKLFQQIDDIVSKISDLDEAVDMIKGVAANHMAIPGFTKDMCTVREYYIV